MRVLEVVSITANRRLSYLASFLPLILLLAGFAAAAILLLVLGPSGDSTSRVGRIVQRIPRGLERLTGIPGWAAATAGTASFGLLVAGQGFYRDVAWHVYVGRDKALFTAPHTMIVVGLGFITTAAAVGIIFATLDGLDTRIRGDVFRIPWSTVPLGVLGLTALIGFPLDDRWHAMYGIDVTMWSPTHLIMILGASLSPLACWLVLAEAGVRPSDSAWARGFHLLVATLALLGLSSAQGEFSFGVPQFEQLYHPIIVALAAAFALTAARLILGRGWALATWLLAAVITLPIGYTHVGPGMVSQRPGALYLTSAIAVELAGLAVGTDRRLRFALASGAAVGTLGMAGEWVYNQHAHQAWHLTLLPWAGPLTLLAAVGASILAVGFAGPTASGGSTVGAPASPRQTAMLIGGLIVIVCLIVPIPRRVANVTANIHLIPAGSAPLLGSQATVQVRLTPPDAADHANWFQALSWQGGGLVIAEMRRGGDGTYVSSHPIPVDGQWKTVLRLHRGTALMGLPIYLPADPELNLPAVPAVDRTVRFANERHFLLREEHGGSGWYNDLLDGLILLCLVGWIVSFQRAAVHIGAPGSRPLRPSDEPDRRDATAESTETDEDRRRALASH
jgi:hypothetical protein